MNTQWNNLEDRFYNLLKKYNIDTNELLEVNTSDYDFNSKDTIEMILNVESKFGGTVIEDEQEDKEQLSMTEEDIVYLENWFEEYKTFKLK